MNENVKEIVNIIGNAELSNKCHKECFINIDFDNECTLCRQATALHKAGYRKQSETVKEFAQKAISRVFEGITQRFYDCYNDGLIRDYPDSELSLNFFIAFNECKDIAKKEINDLAEQYCKEVDR